MKKFVFAFLVLLGAAVISVISPLIYYNYVDKTKQSTRDTEINKIVENIVKQTISPTFYTPEEAVQFHEQKSYEQITDSVFNEIPTDVVRTISTVLIGRNGKTNKHYIVHEFTNNYKDTYKYLRSPLNVNNSNDTIKLPPNVETDTIINGQHFKLIKQTKNNE